MVNVFLKLNLRKDSVILEVSGCGTVLAKRETNVLPVCSLKSPKYIAGIWMNMRESEKQVNIYLGV